MFELFAIAGIAAYVYFVRNGKGVAPHEQVKDPVKSRVQKDSLERLNRDNQPLNSQVHINNIMGYRGPFKTGGTHLTYKNLKDYLGLEGMKLGKRGGENTPRLLGLIKTRMAAAETRVADAVKDLRKGNSLTESIYIPGDVVQVNLPRGWSGHLWDAARWVKRGSAQQ